MDIVSKITGNTLSATEFNQIPTELENLITSSSQTVSDAVLNQDTIAVSRYAANNFYIDSGTADNYVLTLASSFTNPVSATVGYFVGMTIRFRAGNAGTGGAAIVNVGGAGDKSLKEADGTTNPTSIPTTEDTMWRYDGTVFRKINSVVAATESVAGIAKLAEGFVGFVLPYSKNTPPTGWLECNGAAISRTTYSALFAVTGTVFGVGNGSTTFNIPDLRGYFPRGWDNGRGVDSGRAFGSTQTDALQNITGGINLIGNSKTIPITGTGAFSFTSTSASEFTGGGGYANTNGPLTFDASRVARTSTETRPTNLALMYCIKY